MGHTAIAGRPSAAFVPRARRPVHRQRDALAKGLGWLSIGLGLAAFFAPKKITHLVGIDGLGARLLVRAVGLRELVSGLAILGSKKTGPPLSGRVAGDLVDLLLLGAAFRREDAHEGKLVAATAVIAGVTAIDVLASRRQARSELERGLVRRSITVSRSPAEVYAYWRDVENLPRFMRHLESVRVIDRHRSVWSVRGPMGATVSWEAEMIEDVPNERIAWRSVPGSSVDTAGVVRFERAPGDRGTEVHVELWYRPPAGVVGSTFAKLFRRAPEQQIPDELRAFKQILELGEVVRSDATSRGGPHPAQPRGFREMGGER